MSFPSVGPKRSKLGLAGKGTAPLHRQAYPRLEAAIQVEVLVAGSSQVILGVTLNLSRSGMLANLDAPVAVGDECIIRFPRSGSELPLNRETCPECGHQYPVPSIPGQTIKGLVTGVREGAAITMVVFEFEILLEIADWGSPVSLDE